MKLGVLQFFSWPERRVALGTVYDRAIQRIEVMDRSGYDAVWLAEHHFSSFSVCPSVHMIGTLAAARTRRLRIGTAVSLAAFYHPLRLAEEVALLDVLSGGRVNWGGVPPEESTSRFRETVEIVLRAWSDERLNYAGRYFQFENVEVLPKPAQTPLPVWMAASSRPAIHWAAGRGFSILMDPHSSFSELADKRRYYHEGLAAGGFSAAGRDIPMARFVALAETDAKAEAVARRGAGWLTASYVGPGHNAVVQEARDYRGKNLVEHYVDQVILHGTPDRVIDRILALREDAELDYLLCAPLSHESFVMLTDQVLPRLG
jgi:alkanesulfonate monooxygenase SsuD/methylene tetrahydromethanopterin reductase-like flavin-dependent oxidoreductase (luciferase family)